MKQYAYAIHFIQPASLAQLAARQSHNLIRYLKVVSSILTRGSRF